MSDSLLGNALGQSTTSASTALSQSFYDSFTTSNTGGVGFGVSNLLSSATKNTLGALVGSTTVSSKDMRLVIAPAGSTSSFYTGIMGPLITTNGVLFPYAPTINFSQDVDYSSVGNGMVHTNQDYMAYQRTPSVKLTISGKFSIQNQHEGQYMLATIQFFRAVSKMWFGANAGNNAGLPPPILILNGYGTYMFNNLPCILMSHAWDMDDTVDTVDIPDASGGLTKLPSLLTLNITLQVQQTPYNMSTSFDLTKFRSGALIKSGGGWI